MNSAIKRRASLALLLKGPINRGHVKNSTQHSSRLFHVNSLWVETFMNENKFAWNIKNGDVNKNQHEVSNFFASKQQNTASIYDDDKFEFLCDSLSHFPKHFTMWWQRNSLVQYENKAAKNEKRKIIKFFDFGMFLGTK